MNINIKIPIILNSSYRIEFDVKTERVINPAAIDNILIASIIPNEAALLPDSFVSDFFSVFLTLFFNPNILAVIIMQIPAMV